MNENKLKSEFQVDRVTVCDALTVYMFDTLTN